MMPAVAPSSPPCAAVLAAADAFLAGLAGHAGLASLTLPFPAQAIPGFPARAAEACYLARPAEDLLLVGVRAAARARTRGPGRFLALSEALAREIPSWRRADPNGTGQGPRAFLGFAFTPANPAADLLPDAELTVPLVLALRQDGRGAITLTARLAPDQDRSAVLARWSDGLGELLAPRPPAAPPPHLRRLGGEPEDPVWLDRVARAVRDIRAGRLDKVVLTRRVRIAGDRPFDATAVMDRLAARHATGTLFAYSGNGVTAVGATPERLVSLRDRTVRSDALAGTLPLGESLLRSAKDLHEHRLVTEAILSALRPVCEDLDHPRRPRLLRLSALQHLWTPVTGRTRPGVTLLDLAARLHPTPAVGGSPYRIAMDWLAREGERRIGWYTGGVGWLSPDGDGDIAVVLRCAALNGDVAILSAGAGIVAGSDPVAELAETELKLSTMLDALGGA
jgi:menaquinone-specific isochorismate synthase